MASLGYLEVDNKPRRKRSPSPRSIFKRPPSPVVDPQVEAEMNHVKKQVPKALKARLYFLQQPGPNSFLIGGDSPDHKYRVTIGPQTCTCGKDPFCIHLLFVMLRLFQVKETNALLWARDLKNFEVESLFKRFHQRFDSLSKQKFRNMNKSKAPLPPGSLPDPLVAGGHCSHSMSSSKEVEEVCPICLSDLVEGESMTVCLEGCQNRLHHHCMAVWAEECRRKKEKLICPLCRTAWQSKKVCSPSDISKSFVPSVNVLAVNGEDTGLPSGETIPREFESMSRSWVQLFGNDAVACLFSKDWKHRESGLRFISRKAVKILTERRTTVSYNDTKWELLNVCINIITHIIVDPVYAVYIAALRAFRAILGNIKYNQHSDESQIFHHSIKPVIEKILLKCADSNRRNTIVSMKVLMEFIQVDSQENTVLPSTEQYMRLLFSCLKFPEIRDLLPCQWWLGRLIYVKRLFDDHVDILFHTERRFLVNLSLPVSPNSDVDLTEFLNSLQENVLSNVEFSEVTTNRLIQLSTFCVAALSTGHKVVNKCALSLLVKCISMASLDSRIFRQVKQLVHSLKPTLQSTLHRHLSFEAQREQADILNILDEHGDSTASMANGTQNESEDESSRGATASTSSSSVLTPPPSPSSSRTQPKRSSPPESSYDPNLNCVQKVEDEEAAMIAIALNKSTQRPEDVIPEQLVPIDDLTLVHIQPGGNESEECPAKNIYIENIHWKKGGLLGTGAFSSCFEAMDFKSGRLMAVKQISFCRNSEEEQQKVHEVVLEEIALMHRLKHPHIVACLGATQHENHYNLFMELMPGGSICRLLSRFGKFREPVIISYTRQILLAVSFLHQHHCLHRDLKGANILVDSTGQTIKLSDFGTAARLMAHGTGTREFCGQLLGTIPFMAPEVLRGEHYGRKCDIWSLGCCVIEMASGKPPWGNENVDNYLALMFKIASALTGPHLPSSLGPALKDLALRCLELKESDRPTAQELLRHAVFRT